MVRQSSVESKSTSQESTQATGTTGQAEQINPFVMMRAINRAPIGSGQVRILHAIADCAGHGRGVCTASYAFLAQAVNTTRRNTMEMVAGLANALLIVKEPARNGNVIRLGPRLLELYQEQVHLEDLRRQSKSKTPRHQKTAPIQPVKSASPLPAPAPVKAASPQVVKSTSPPSEVSFTSAGEVSFTQTSSLTTQETSSSTSEAKTDDDDASLPGEKKKTLEGVEDVCDVIKRCKQLPGGLEAKIREDATLGYQIKGDWMTLALAAMRLDQKIRDRDAPPAKKIQKPLAYLLGVFDEIRDDKFPPGERDGLAAKVERLRQVPENAGPVRASCDGLSEADYRGYVSGWICKADAQGRPLDEIKPAILAHIDRHGAENSYTPREIENRKLWASREIDNWLAARSPRPIDLSGRA